MCTDHSVKLFSPDFQMKMVSPMEKILPWQGPSGDKAETLLSGFRGETISLQLGCCLKTMPRDIKLEVNAPEGIQVRVRTVELVPCAYPYHAEKDDDYLADRPGLYPDLLKDLTPFGIRLTPNHWKSLWIDCETTEQTKKGDYSIRLTISTMESEPLGELTFSIEVLDAVLPPLPILHTEWFHSDCLATYYQVEIFSEEHWRILENFISTAARRGCNMILTPIFTPPLDTAIGGERPTVQLIDITLDEDGYSFSYEKFERWIAMCRKCGMKYFEISHLFSQWGAKYTPKVVVKVNGKEEKHFGWHTSAVSREYLEFLQQLLPSLTNELQKLGIEKQCYFHISDEPSINDLDSYAVAKNLVKDYLKDYPIVDALSDYTFYQSGLIKEPICATNHLEPFLKDRPEKLWAYYCTGQYLDVSNRFIAMPGYRTRILGTQLYKYQMDGFLQWGFNFYYSHHSLYPINPYQCTDAGEAFPSGDPFIVYPGADGKPEESIRLMLMEEAMNDLRAMTLLEQLTDRATVLSCLEEDVYGELTFKEYPRSAAYLTRIRTNINAAIQKALS